MPRDKFDFASFVSAIARRYKGRVAAYEIWNEQNLQQETGAPVNVGQYFDLLQVGYSNVKWMDPDAVVIYGGLNPDRRQRPELGIDDVIYLQQSVHRLRRREALPTRRRRSTSPSPSPSPGGGRQPGRRGPSGSAAAQGGARRAHGEN